MFARIAMWEPMPDDDRQWVIDAAKSVAGVRDAYHPRDPATGNGLSIAFFDDDSPTGSRESWHSDPESCAPRTDRSVVSEQSSPSSGRPSGSVVSGTKISSTAHLVWLHVLLGAVTAYLTACAVHYSHGQLSALASLVTMLAGLSWLVWVIVAMWTLHAVSTPNPAVDLTPVEWVDGENGERVRR